MCWVHGDRGKQRIELPLAVVVHEGQRRLIQFVDAEDANSLLRKFRPQALVPTGILFLDEVVGYVFDQFRSSTMVRPSGVVELWPSSSCCNRPPTRTSKNSSRLLAEIARNLTRSSSGLRRSPASSSTRPLNFSHEASRLRSVARLFRVARTMFEEPYLSNGICRR